MVGSCNVIGLEIVVRPLNANSSGTFSMIEKLLIAPPLAVTVIFRFTVSPVVVTISGESRVFSITGVQEDFLVAEHWAGVVPCCPVQVQVRPVAVEVKLETVPGLQRGALLVRVSKVCQL
ncbi:MAG: hypothetical protein LBD75_02315 [Candidatus Peribacteria bacterium]|nr:hypothetical protein [Candidatus Peribacteria bacterium]